MVVGNDGESDCRIPAGWSAAGQPNDAIHQFWHALRKARERVAIGCQSELVATCKRVQVHAHIHMYMLACAFACKQPPKIMMVAELVCFADVCRVHRAFLLADHGGLPCFGFQGQQCKLPPPHVAIQSGEAGCCSQHKFWCERGRGTGAAVVLQRCSWGRDRRLCPAGRGFTYICRGRTEEGRKSAERSSWHQVLSSENVGSPLCACDEVGIAVSSSASNWTVSRRAWTAMGSWLPSCRWMMLLQVFAHACTCANVRVASRTCAIFDTSLPTAVVAMLIV